MRETLEVFGLAAIIVVFSLAIAAGIMTAEGVYRCSAYEAVTGRETKFAGFECYGLVDGVWYSFDEYSKLIVPNRQQIELP